jgi:formate dehydrogenase major subunit
MPDDLGTGALQAVDKLLADRPEKVGHDFSEATRRLTAYRDALITQWRQTHSEADRRQLERTNAVLSVIVGGQFPIGSVPWPHIERARADLADVIMLSLREGEADEASPVK